MGIPSWRSSTLAVMVHGIRDVEGDFLEYSEMRGRAGKERISMFQDWAGGLDVRLRRRGDTGLGYSLVRVEGTSDH